jgi:hypothetical protein
MMEQELYIQHQLLVRMMQSSERSNARSSANVGFDENPVPLVDLQGKFHR